MDLHDERRHGHREPEHLQLRLPEHPDRHRLYGHAECEHQRDDHHPHHPVPLHGGQSSDGVHHGIHSGRLLQRLFLRG